MFPGCEVIDAAGQYIVPGGVDGHVHFGGFGDLPIADDFYSGSCAALAGGTTTVVDFCKPLNGQSPMDVIARRKQDAQSSAVDYAFHFTFTESYPEELPYLDRIYKEGITAFKVYTYYDHTSLTAGDIRTVMQTIGSGGALLVHAEEKSIIDCMKMKYKNTGSDMLPLSLTRPNIAEKLAVENVLAISKETGTKLCIAHASAAETVEIKKREDCSGNKNFFLETCPHYMEFTSEKLTGEEGVLYTMNPPLREQKDCDALMAAAMTGGISMLSTDHCPYLKKYKKTDTTYETVPCGIDGVQTRMEYLFSEGVIKRGLSMESFVSLTSANAARFYNLYPKKGAILPGSDADLAFFSINGKRIYSSREAAGNTDYTIFEGFPILGRCTCTIKSGKIVMRNGKVSAEKGSGRFLFTKVRNV